MKKYFTIQDSNGHMLLFRDGTFGNDNTRFDQYLLFDTQEQAEAFKAEKGWTMCDVVDLAKFTEFESLIHYNLAHCNPLRLTDASDTNELIELMLGGFAPYKIVDADEVNKFYHDKPNLTFDVVFNDDNNSNSKGFKQSLEYCKKWIEMHSGSNHSYFNDYKTGTVSIVCNETSTLILNYICSEVLRSRQ